MKIHPDCLSRDTCIRNFNSLELSCQGLTAHTKVEMHMLISIAQRSRQQIQNIDVLTQTWTVPVNLDRLRACAYHTIQSRCYIAKSKFAGYLGAISR